MLLTYKNYVKTLFIILMTLLVIATAYAYYFAKNYPLPITNRMSFDAKITFIKENIDIAKIDTIIVGSSIGLNNVQGLTLEQSSKKIQGVLNLSVYEATPTQIEQVLELSSVFPNLKRIIYSAQYSDFAYAGKLKEYDPVFIKAYLGDSLSLKEKLAFYFNSCKNVFFLIRREWNWGAKYMQANQFTYLGFDASGSVPLRIYGKDIIKHRWENPHSNKQSKHAYSALDRMSKRAKKEGVDFIFVMQPYRQPLYENYKHVKLVMRDFSNKTEKIMKKNGGSFVNLHKKLNLSDKYFADRSHLNYEGAVIGSKAIGEFVDSIN